MKIKLTAAETMLVSIANTERDQSVQQIDSIYRTRIQALLDTHNVTWKSMPEVIQEGKDFYLTVPLPAPDAVAVGS